MPGPRSSARGIKPKREPAPPPSSSAGARGPVRGKPEYIQKRRRIKGAKQGARLTRQNTIDSQPSGRGRGRQDDPAREAQAALRAERVYGDSERRVYRGIRYASALERAQDQLAARNDKPSWLERAASDVGDTLGTEIPGSKAVANLVTKAAVDRQFGSGTAEKITDAVGREPYEDDITVAEAALAAAPLGAGKAIKAGTLVRTSTAGKAAGRAASKVKAAPKSAVKAAASRAPKTASKVKAAGAAAKRSAAKAKTGRPGKAAAATARGTKKVYHSKPAKVAGAPIRIPAKHPGYSAAALVTGPGAVKASQTKDPNDLRAPLQGFAQAVTENPGKVAKTTARAIPGLLTAPVDIAANVGLSGYRAAHAAIPGGPEYSGKEIAEPTKTVAEETYGFGKKMVEDFGSGDADRIQKAIEEDYGLTPLVIAGIPGAKGVRRVTRGRVGAAARKTPKVGPAVGRKIDARRARKAQAREAAHARELGEHGAQNAAKPIIKAARKTDERKTIRKRNQKMDSSETLKTVAEEGIVTVEQAKKVLARKGERPKDLPEEYINVHDALQYVIDNPEILRSKAYKEMRESLRRASDEVATSARAKGINQAITWGIRLPEERYLDQRAVLLRRDPRGRDADDPNQLSLVPEGELPKNRRRQLEELEAKAERDFQRDLKELRKREGLDEPIWTSDSDLLRREGLAASPAYPKRASKKQHQSKGILAGQARADQSFAALLEGTVRAPRVKRAMHGNTARSMEAMAKTITVRGPKGQRDVRYATSAEVREAARSKQIDPENDVVVDAQQFQQAVLDPTVTDKGTVEYGDVSLGEFIRMRNGEAKNGLTISKGKKYVVADKAAVKEFFAQLDPTAGKIPGVTRSQQLASQAILGYNPSWSIIQPIAESAQMLAAQSNPLAHIKGRRALRRMDPKAREEFRAQVGATAGFGDLRDVTSSLDPKTSTLAAEFGKARRTRTGRIASGILTARYTRNADKVKGAAIREQAAAAKMASEYDGFLNGMRRLTGTQAKLEAKLPLEKRMERVARDRALGRELESYVDDVMGNWRALTKNERMASSMVVFYPFVRMSLQWTFHTFPKRHPIKASIQHFLAQSQAEQVEKMLGGNPSFFTQWANAPLYAGKDGEPTSMIPLGRLAPGSNALVEAVGGDAGFSGLTRAINPVVGAAFASLAGKDPVSGRSLIESGERPSSKQVARSFAAALLAMPAPVRVADTLSGGKGLDKIKGKEATPTGALFDTLQGSPLKKALRSTVLPLAPLNTAKQRQMAEISRLIERKFKQPEFGEVVRAAQEAISGKDRQAAYDAAETLFDAIKADKHLDRVFKRYGIDMDLSSDVQGLAGTLTGKGGYNLDKQTILDSLREANIPIPPNARKIRRIQR